MLIKIDNSRVALFGGSFDPIHNGHIIIINHLVDQFDKVIIMPANISPHKTGTPPRVSNDHRCNMIRLALKTIPGAEISTYEIDKNGPSYTVETIQYLRKFYSKLELVIGYDQYVKFKQWYKWQKIIDSVNVNVIARGDSIIPKINNKIYNFIQIENLDISSTMIRKNINNNKSIRTLVPNLVERYILEHDLYKTS